MSKGTICIISSQILNEKKIGGFGSMTFQLAKYLSEQNWCVKILVPRRAVESSFSGAGEIEIYRYSKIQLFSKKYFKQLNADIFHSQNQTLASSVARFYFPDKKHVITCRDPRSFKDWVNEFKNATFLRKLKTPLSYLTEESFLATWSIKKADVVACPAHCLIPKIKKMYQLKSEPIFLPNLESIPEEIPVKSKTPVVCWVGRFAKRKNPEGFLELAEKFPKVQFLIVGKAEESDRQRFLEKWMDKLPNVKNYGFIDKFRNPNFYDIYNKSWILINTSTREGLPLTFIEAAGRACAILSYVNPDNFASKFGSWAMDKNFEEGLQYLLKDYRYKILGEHAFNYVRDVYSLQKAGDSHSEIYEYLLN